MTEGLKKFYVGSNSVTPEWTKKTLKEAVDQATAMVASGEQEEAFVVEIKRVVRKRPQPVEVKPFKG